MINLIVAIDQNNAIGYKNNLLYKLKGDMKHFKELTLNHKVIMGKNTFLSLPKCGLPNRQNIVLTSKADEMMDIICKEGSLIYADNIKELINEYKDSNEEVFVIGGEKIYSQFLNYANKIYLTYIEKSSPNADCWFFYDCDEWEEDSDSIKYHTEDGIDYYFIELNRI